MNNSLRNIVAVLLAIAWIAFPVLADDGASTDTDADSDAVQDLQPQKITVEESAPHIPRFNSIGTRLAIPFLWTPFHLGTVNDPVLRDQDARVLGDALKNVSGLNPQTQSGVGDYFLVRGFDSVSSGLVLTDGASEPELTFYQMYNVDRVEVLKGPGGFLYSRNGLSGATAGAVNIVRRQPMPGRFTNVNLSGGSYSSVQGTVDWNFTGDDDRFGVRLNSMYQQSDAYRDDKDNDVFAVNPAFTWLLGSDTSLNLNLEYVNTDYKPDSGLPLLDNEIPDVNRKTSYQSPFDRSEQDITRIQVDLETHLSDSWTLRNKTFYRHLDWKSDGTLFNGVFPSFFTGRPEVSRSLTLLDDDQTFIGNQMEGVWSRKGATLEHNLLTGLELARYSDDFHLDLGCDRNILNATFGTQCLLPSLDLFNPNETAKGYLELSFDRGDSHTDVAAPYAIYQIKYRERFQALAGARLDLVDFDDDASNDSRDDSDVSPMLGLVYSPVKNLSLYANASESFAPPSARVDDPRPEKGQQLELGIKMESFQGRLITSAAGYQLKRKDIPIPDANGFTQQSGDQRSRGFELEIVAEPLPRFRTFLSYSYIDAELTDFAERVIFGPGPGDFFVVDRSGNDPAFVPKHMVNLWVSKRFENGLGVGGGGRYVSSQYIDEDNEFDIDDYATLDAAVYYDFGDWDLSMNFKNITDEEYETRGFSNTSVIPANGFTIYGTVGYSF